MKRVNTLSYILSLCVLLMTWSSCVFDRNTNEEASLIQVGDALPIFSVIDNSGNTFSNESLKGTYSFIFFFYTPCPDCQIALPIMNELYRNYQQDDRMQWIAIGRDESQTNVADYWQEYGYIIPYSYQTNRTIYNQFAMRGIPRLYISNPEGIVIAEYTDTNFPSKDALQSIINNFSIN